MAANLKKKNDSSYSTQFKQKVKTKVENDIEIHAIKKINFDEISDWDDVYKKIEPQTKNEEIENKNDYSINTSDFTNRPDINNYDGVNLSNLNQNDVNNPFKNNSPLNNVKKDQNEKNNINTNLNANSNNNGMPSTYFIYNKPIIQFINSNFSNENLVNNLP